MLRTEAKSALCFGHASDDNFKLKNALLGTYTAAVPHCAT